MGVIPPERKAGKMSQKRAFAILGRFIGIGFCIKQNISDDSLVTFYGSLPSRLTIFIRGIDMIGIVFAKLFDRFFFSVSGGIHESRDFRGGRLALLSGQVKKIPEIHGGGLLLFFSYAPRGKIIFYISFSFF